MPFTRLWLTVPALPDCDWKETFFPLLLAALGCNTSRLAVTAFRLNSGGSSRSASSASQLVRPRGKSGEV